MLRKALASSIYYKACCFVFYFVVAAASFNGYYHKWHFAELDAPGDDLRYHFEMMMDGTAYRPYVQRQLLPAAANWIDSAVPRSFETWLYSWQNGPNAHMDQFFDTQTAENPDYFFRYLIVYIITFLFTLLAVYAMYLVCRELEIPPPAAVFAPAIVILLFPYIESEGGFFYDYPELAFLALAVWVALRFPWWSILPIAALGAWNKESFVLVIPTLYPFIRRRCSRPVACLGVAVLCLVCVAVYYPIRLRFAHNPGGALELHWRDQLSYYAHPLNHLFGIEMTYGLLAVKAFSVVPMTLLAWTLWRAWRYLPGVVQRHAIIAAAINIPLYLLFCWPGEIRNLSLLYVVFLLLLAVNLNHWIAGFAMAKSASSQP
jgi:hypothetical protein